MHENLDLYTKTDYLCILGRCRALKLSPRVDTVCGKNSYLGGMKWQWEKFPLSVSVFGGSCFCTIN